MLELTSHVIRISSRRDRTEINAALVDALLEMFQPLELTIYRCYPSRQRCVVYACAGYAAGANFLRNAYLPEHDFCRDVDADPLWQRCAATLTPVIGEPAAGRQRVVFPIASPERLHYLVDLNLPDSLSADRRVTLMGLVEYFGNHIALLDYGESDTLTGLASRKTFDKHLFELLGQAAHDAPERGARRASGDACHWLAVCDIDFFKRVNDSYGHLIGDEVLILVAQVMRNTLRFDDQLFRFGGEEFIALLQPASPEMAQRVLDRFRAAIEETVFSRVGHVTISVGFSRLLPNDTPNDVIDRADEALYYAKRHGRNRVDGYERLLASGAVAARETVKGDIELF